jgi:hypothetical protein
LKMIFKQYGVECEGNISSHLFRKTLGCFWWSCLVTVRFQLPRIIWESVNVK